MTIEQDYQHEIKQWEEKDMLFQHTEAELAEQPAHIQYAHMRYVREIEAHEYVKFLRTGYVYRKAAILAREAANDIVKNWNSVKKHPSTWA